MGAKAIEQELGQEAWSDLPEIQAALQSHEIVAIVSGVTDFREAERLLDEMVPGRWQRLEWSMGSAENRSRFHQLQIQTGFPHLPMFIGRQGLIGGQLELRQMLAERAGVAGAVEQSLDARKGDVLEVKPGQQPEPEPGRVVDLLLYRLGFAGLIPFVFLGLAAWLPLMEWRGYALYALAAYAAVILSFLGAVHWGLYLRSSQHRVLALPAPYWAVVPSILAWIALLLPLPYGLLLLTLSFPLVLAIDVLALPRGQMPGGYIALRGYLTLIAVISLVSGLILAL